MDCRLREQMPEDPLVVYTDYVAPACYLVEPVLDALQRNGMSVERRPFELFPAPLPLPDFGSVADTAAWREVIEPLGVRHGLTMHRPRRAVRTRKAHEAVLYARSEGRGDALHRAIFAAYYAEGLDIARVDVLVRLGETIGLGRSALKVVLDLDTYADEVAAMRAAALRSGIAAAPAFLAARGGRARTLIGYHDERDVRGWLTADLRASSPEHEREKRHGEL